MQAENTNIPQAEQERSHLWLLTSKGKQQGRPSCGWSDPRQHCQVPATCVWPQRTPQCCSCWVVLQLRLIIWLEKLGGTQKKHQPLGFVHLLLHCSFIKYLHPLPYVWSNAHYVRKFHCAECFLCMRDKILWSSYEISVELHSITEQQGRVALFPLSILIQCGLH